MAFFTSWQVWLKLTFVLACAICVVLVYAVGVRYSKKRQLKKSAILAATEIAERGEMGQSGTRSDQVPFGIRAIERGCAVEGVWNSKATTPLQTPPSSKASSPVLKAAKHTLKKHKRDSSLSTMSHVDIAEPALGRPTSRGPMPGIWSSPSGSAGTTAGNPVTEGMEQSRLDTSMRDRPPDGPGPALYNERPVTTIDYGIPSCWFGARMGPSSTSHAEELSEQLNPDDSASQTSNSHGDVSNLGKHHLQTQGPSDNTNLQPAIFQLRKASLSKGVETLEYMNAHRRCHAAETGQLIPRVRPKASSGDFSKDLTAATCETGRDHSAVRSVSWPMSSADSPTGSTTISASVLPPNLEDLPIRVLAKHIPLPPLRYSGADGLDDTIQLRGRGRLIPLEHASLVENQPPWRATHYSLCIQSQVATSKRCPSSWTDRLHQQAEEIKKDYQTSAGFPLTESVLSYHNQTARKVNPGFEVLPAGTLQHPGPVKQWGDATSVLAEPSNEIRWSRKLQKRDRSRSKSRRSSSEHERSSKHSAQ